MLYIHGTTIVVMAVYVVNDEHHEMEYTLIVHRSRFATGRRNFVELPSGLMTSTEGPENAARRILYEHTGIDAEGSQLINMTSLHFHQVYFCLNDVIIINYLILVFIHLNFFRTNLFMLALGHQVNKSSSFCTE